MYSTCSISPAENDLVIARFLEKYGFSENECEEGEKEQGEEKTGKRRERGKDRAERAKAKGVRVKHGACDVVAPHDWPVGRRTQYGWMIMPNDGGQGWGPIYMCILRKVKEKEEEEEEERK